VKQHREGERGQEKVASPGPGKGAGSARRLILGLALVLALQPGCGHKEQLEFWHTRTGAQQVVLQDLVREFNRTSGGKPIVPVYVRDYQDVRTKVLNGIRTHRLPLLAVCYESQVQEYAGAGVVKPVEDFVRQPGVGLSESDLGDIYSQFLETNRFSRFGNQLLSFPFTKSLLLMAYNQTLLQGMGTASAPTLWTEFQTVARAARSRTGRTPCPFVMDASTLDGMIFSYGGEVLEPDGKTTLFDQAPTIRTLAMLRDWSQQGIATETPAQNLLGLFGSGQVPFLFGTSSGRTPMEKQVGDKFQWDVAIIPHAPGVRPVTVLYGPNVCIFKRTSEDELLAWRFINYFTSAPVTARWSRETGYLPVRKSAATLPEMESFWKSNPRAFHAFQMLPRSKVEPNVPGWDDVRRWLQEAASLVMSGRTTPEAAAQALKQKADARLAGGTP
jgi:ABC-type glycerol-3-phosphate transport system substrate-binding protein